MIKAVAFIDLLGFSSLVNRNAADAVMAVSQYNTIISQLIFERQIHPSSGYIPVLQNLAMRTSCESFEEFLPFSDSVFVTASRCDDFVLQLGSFVRNSFLLTSRFYEHPANPADPTLVSIPSIGTTNRVDSHVPPVLFRGGLSYGDVQLLKPVGLADGQNITTNVITGVPVVKAVGMEKSGIKGPRLIFDESLYARLSANVRRYCRVLPENEDYYEILWPMMGYIEQNPFSTENSHIRELLEPAYNLWQEFVLSGDSKVEIQYFKFLEIIIVSAVQAYDLFWNQRNCAKKIIERFLDSHGIKDKFANLL